MKHLYVVTISRNEPNYGKIERFHYFRTWSGAQRFVAKELEEDSEYHEIYQHGIREDQFKDDYEDT